MKNLDLTGKLVFGHGGEVDMTPCIYMDSGAYEGTIKEYNIRKVKTIHVFDYLKILEYDIQEKECYGMRQGGGISSLYKATEEEIETLINMNEKNKVEHELKEAKELLESQIEWANRIMQEVESRRIRGVALLTNNEEQGWRVGYNNFNNEGGEGYIPTRATVESYNQAIDILENNK